MPHAEFIELLVSWVLSTALSFAVVLYDERRMSDERRERAWPSATRTLAIAFLGVLALPVHFARTRGGLRSARSGLGLALGLLVGLLIAFVIGIIAGVAGESLGVFLGRKD